MAFLTSPGHGQNVETLVCFRHGEKQPDGLGQLDCQGLNRSLALPKVLLSKFGTPQFIFAPMPTLKDDDEDKAYYVRPLATVEPTAIYCGMPVQLPYAYTDIKGLQSEMEKSKYRHSTIFIAWEHAHLEKFVKNLISSLGGDTSQIPHWHYDDFDSIYVVKITRAHGVTSAIFTHDHENLNGLSKTYP